jgi:hypothetical protein
MFHLREENTAEGIMRRLEQSLSQSREPEPEKPPAPPRRKPITRSVRGGRVLFYPAAEGVIRIVGLGPSDNWLAEFSCLEADFKDEFLRRMERHVARKTGARMSLVG